MKNPVRLAIFVALLVSSSVATAQIGNCVLITYSDQWTDDSGNLLALNSSFGDFSCGGFGVYADAEIQMPSGYYASAFATGIGDFAEAIAIAPMLNESGTGSVGGTNEVEYDCGVSLSSVLAIILFHVDQCVCSLKDKEGDNCRLPCACVPGFDSEDIVQTTERLARACLSKGTTVPEGTCPLVVDTTRLSIGTEDAFIAFDRVNACFTTVH